MLDMWAKVVELNEEHIIFFAMKLGVGNSRSKISCDNEFKFINWVKLRSELSMTQILRFRFVTKMCFLSLWNSG